MKSLKKKKKVIVLYLFCRLHYILKYLTGRVSGILNDYVAYPPVVEEDFNQLETFSFLHSPGFDPKGR